MTKFDYLKISGCLEEIRVFEHFSDVVQVIMRVDGVVIPNFKIPLAIYEELEEGSQVEIYALVQNSKNKIKNIAVVYAVRTANGRLLSVPSMRYKVQISILITAAIMAAIAFVVSFIGFAYMVDFLFSGGRMSISGQGTLATWLASITGLAVGAFFAGTGVYLFYKTTVLDTWQSVAPARVVERFSKLHR